MLIFRQCKGKEREASEVSRTELQNALNISYLGSRTTHRVITRRLHSLESGQACLRFIFYVCKAHVMSLIFIAWAHIHSKLDLEIIALVKIIQQKYPNSKQFCLPQQLPWGNN